MLFPPAYSLMKEHFISELLELKHSIIIAQPPGIWYYDKSFSNISRTLPSTVPQVTVMVTSVYLLKTFEEINAFSNLFRSFLQSYITDHFYSFRRSPRILANLVLLVFEAELNLCQNCTSVERSENEINIQYVNFLMPNTGNSLTSSVTSRMSHKIWVLNFTTLHRSSLLHQQIM